MGDAKIEVGEAKKFIVNGENSSSTQTLSATVPDFI
jgi:hypothetical protein